MDSKEAGDSPHHYDYRLVGEHMKWVPNSGILYKRKLHFMNSLALHQQMATLLHLIFKDKQVETYNIFSSLEDINCMLHNERFCLDNVDSRLAHVEVFFVSDSTFGDLTNFLLIKIKDDSFHEAFL